MENFEELNPPHFYLIVGTGRDGKCSKKCIFANKRSDMKKLIIRNIGPLLEVNIELSKYNVIIGPQSSGKSCVLKIACYCTWVEKQIELNQSADIFKQDGYFIQELTRFHKLEGYFSSDSFIEYESDYTKFSYNAHTNQFLFEWKDTQWNYMRPKVSYIPAERNMVAAIPTWFDVRFYNNNIQSFMGDWDIARKIYTQGLNILNLDVVYRYDKLSGRDLVDVGEGVVLELTNTSSGLQSLIPLFVHLNYVGKDSYAISQAKSYSDLRTEEKFLQKLYDERYKDKITQDNQSKELSFTIATIGKYSAYFKNQQDAEECRRIYERYTQTDHCELFLEEPENNLFPPTQSCLVDWLINLVTKESDSIFIATHSPYIMTAFLERELKEFKLFFEKRVSRKSIIVTASEADIQEIYDDGIDVFYNIESYT